MKTKKSLAALIALALALSLSPAVFASPSTTTAAPEVTVNTSGAPASASIDVYSTLNVPTIKVTVNAMNSIIANPYKLTFKVSNEDESKKSLINTASSIINESETKIDVTITASAEVKGAVQMASDSTAAEESKDMPMIYLQLKTGAIAPSDDQTASLTTALTTFDGTTGTLTDLGTGVKITMNAKDETASLGPKNSYAAYAVAGATGGNWKSTDSVNISVTFDIQPVA